MVEMQTAAAPAGQAAPAAPALPGQPTGTTVVDLSKYTLRQLQRMLAELRDQRRDLASRRETIAGNYEGATGASREGIGERLRILDANIVSYEAEIARVGREVAARGGGTNVDVPQFGGVPPGYMPEDDAAGMAFGFSFATLLLAVFFTRRFMRRKYAGAVPMGRQQPNMIASNERLERIEQAVDSIAIEVERVSENQRFMTRLMTETQLGDTIKEVRKSAELAKSAAADSPG